MAFLLAAGMSFDGREEIVSAPIVEKEDALSDSPQGRRAKFVSIG